MDKNSYALGMSIAHNMLSSGIKDIAFDDFVAGVKALLNGEEPAISFQEAGQLLDKYFAELEAERKAEAEAMAEKKYTFVSAQIEMVPQNYQKLESEEHIKLMEKLIDIMEEDDDVQNIWHNWEE